MNKWLIILKEEEKRMNEKIKKLCLVFMVLMVCGLSITSKAYANDTKEDPKFPTVEEIMRDYQVSEEEAEIMLERMIEEHNRYQNDSSIKSSNSTVAEQKKQMLEEAMKRSQVQPLGCIIDGVDCNRVKKELAMPFYRQENYYYCGPAATQMALAARGVYVSQSTLASDTWLETDKYKDTVGRYIKYTLNKLLGTDWYVYKQVNEDNKSKLVERVQLNINNGYVPIVAVYQNGEEEDRKLKGHTYDYLRHFIPIYGYNGDIQIAYKDSSSGLGGRFKDVPQSAWISSSTLSYLIWGGSITY